MKTWKAHDMLSQLFELAEIIKEDLRLGALENAVDGLDVFFVTLKTYEDLIGA